MTKIDMLKNQEGKVIGFRIEGHAGFDKKGKDIVCAAISMLSINTINSIKTFTEDEISLIQDEKQGLIFFHITSDVSQQSELLLNSFALGMSSIAEQYGRKFITFTN